MKLLGNFKFRYIWFGLVALSMPTLLSAAGDALVTVPKTLSTELCFDQPYPDDLRSSTARFTGSFGSWSVFIDKDPRQCWLLTKPTKTNITKRKTKPKYCRNDPYLMVNFIPSEDVFAEVSYISGHDLDDKSEVEVISGDQKFHLSITKGQIAWTKNATMDGLLLGSMRNQKVLNIGSRSAQGNIFVDTFKVGGLNFAIESVKILCGEPKKLPGDSG